MRDSSITSVRFPVNAMPVCRICLKQSFKDVFDLDFGLPNIREKLIICMPILDIHLLDNSYVVCETCLTALNTAYDLRETLLRSQCDIKSIMTAADASIDFDNLEKYAFEASVRRERYLQSETINLGSGNKYEVEMETRPCMESQIAEGTAEGLNRSLSPSSVHSGPTYDIPMPNDVPIQEMPSLAFGASSAELENSTITALEKSSPTSMSLSVQSQFADPPKFLQLDNPELLMQFVEGRMCHICFRQYPNKTCLQSHIKSVHESGNRGFKRKSLNNLLSSLTPTELADINREVSKKCVATECEECKIRLRCMHEMEYHVTAVHKKYPINTVHFGVRCLVCNLQFNHTYLDFHMKGHELKAKWPHALIEQPNSKNMLVQFWHCQICNVMFKNSDQSIEEHLRLHRRNNDEVIIS